MRVIAGSARRILLKVVEGSETRPFLEKARGALFNALAAYVPDATVLDLYAGSGALGIEALSRGASRCVFVEKDRTCAECLRQNLRSCKLEASAQVLAQPVENALQGLRQTFDLIFMDPPFRLNPEWNQEDTAQSMMKESARLLADDGLLIFRYEQDKTDAPVWPELELLRDRKYGRSRVCIYGHPEADDESQSGKNEAPEPELDQE